MNEHLCIHPTLNRALTSSRLLKISNLQLLRCHSNLFLFRWRNRRKHHTHWRVVEFVVTLPLFFSKEKEGRKIIFWRTSLEEMNELHHTGCAFQLQIRLLLSIQKQHEWIKKKKKKRSFRFVNGNNGMHWSFRIKFRYQLSKL